MACAVRAKRPSPDVAIGYERTSFERSAFERASFEQLAAYERAAAHEAQNGDTGVAHSASATAADSEEKAPGILARLS